MYTDYFGLAEMPYRITPDPRFLWYSGQHLEARDKIRYHLTNSAGPIYLLADVGTGKTTIARRLMQELATDENKQVVFIPAPALSTTNAFLRFVMDEFAVKTERAYANSLKNFESYLIAQYNDGVSPILLIDEAQNMTRDMLLLIQHLFNFSTDTQFLIQMALFGQPELQSKLDRLKSLKSRMSIARLKPFDLDGTSAMLQFRWTVAGGKMFPFTDQAVQSIQQITKGVPRSVVKLANEALIKTAVDQKKRVNKDAVTAASHELAI